MLSQRDSRPKQVLREPKQATTEGHHNLDLSKTGSLLPWRLRTLVASKFIYWFSEEELCLPICVTADTSSKQRGEWNHSGGQPPSPMHSCGRVFPMMHLRRQNGEELTGARPRSPASDGTPVISSWTYSTLSNSAYSPPFSGGEKKLCVEPPQKFGDGPASQYEPQGEPPHPQCKAVTSQVLGIA